VEGTLSIPPLATKGCSPPTQPGPREKEKNLESNALFVSLSFFFLPLLLFSLLHVYPVRAEAIKDEITGL